MGTRTGMAITHAEALGRPFVTANKDELGDTNVTGLYEAQYLQSRVVRGKNLLFSSAFPLVWEEVARVGGSTILMQYDPPLCVGLQGESDYRNDLDPPAFFAAGNYGSAGVLSDLREGLTAHFAGASSPTLIPDSIDAEHLFAYAYVFKHLLYDEREGRSAQIAGGLRAEDFILDLPVKSAEDRLVIASIVPSDTISETVERVLSPRTPFTSSGMPAAWALERYRVPRIHFDVTWKFRNTSARYLLKVDEFGVTILSEAAQTALPAPTIIVARPGERMPAPVIIILARRNAKRPYFVALLEHTELLIPDAMG
jgi:hypothetical protein